MDDLDLIMFGKYCGQTFLSVWESDQAHCQWVLTTVEQRHQQFDQSMYRFAKYIFQKVQQHTIPQQEWEEVPPIKKNPSQVSINSSHESDCQMENDVEKYALAV